MPTFSSKFSSLDDSQATATPIVVYEVSPEVHGELVSVTARNVRMGGLPISISHLPRFRVWTPEA